MGSTAKARDLGVTRPPPQPIGEGGGQSRRGVNGPALMANRGAERPDLSRNVRGARRSIRTVTRGVSDASLTLLLLLLLLYRD